MDGDAIAAAPARRKVRLDRGERQDAAPVRSAVGTPVELVGDGEASAGSGGAGPADADARPADHRAAAAHEERATRQVDVQLEPRPRVTQAASARIDPHDAVAVDARLRDGEPPSVSRGDDSECAR